MTLPASQNVLCTSDAPTRLNKNGYVFFAFVFLVGAASREYANQYCCGDAVDCHDVVLVSAADIPSDY